MSTWPEEEPSVFQAKGTIFQIHGNGICGLFLHGEIYLKLDMIFCFVERSHSLQKHLKTFPMFRRYGEVEPTDATVVSNVFRCLHQVLLKGRATHILGRLT
jgi:hypothetical protein